MFKENELINNKELIDRLGNKKQIESYYKNNKLLINIKKSVLRKLKIYASFEEIKINNRIYYRIIKVNSERKIIENEINFSRSKLIFLIRQMIVFNISSTTKLEYYSVTRVIKELDIFKKGYFELINCNEYLSDLLEVDRRSIKIFKTLVAKEIRRLIKYSIETLKVDKVISGKIGVIVVNSRGKHRALTKKEELIFDEIKSSVILNMNEKSLIDICFKGLYKSYVKKVSYELTKKNCDCKVFYQGFKINKVNLDNFNLYENEIGKISKAFGSEFRKRIVELARTLRDSSILKSKKELEFGEILLKKHQESETFIDDVIKISNFFIR